MAMPGMQEGKLDEKTTEEEIPPLAEWICTAEFKVVKEQSWEICTDGEKESRLEKLLAEPHIKDKVTESSRQHILRISGPIPGFFGSPQGPAYIYPLRIHRNTRPRVGNIHLKVGWFIDIKDPTFVITRGADCLIILTVDASVPQTQSGLGEVESAEAREDIS